MQQGAPCLGLPCFKARSGRQLGLFSFTSGHFTELPTSYLPIYLHTYLPVYLPIYLHTYVPTYLPSHIPTYPPTYLPTYLPSHIPTDLLTYLASYLPTYPSPYFPTYTTHPPQLLIFSPTYRPSFFPPCQINVLNFTLADLHSHLRQQMVLCHGRF